MPGGMLQTIGVTIDTMYRNENLPPLSKPELRYIPIAHPQIATKTTHTTSNLASVAFGLAMVADPAWRFTGSDVYFSKRRYDFKDTVAQFLLERPRSICSVSP
jgi:hypothetical protein